jgi:hypothetical protein
MDGGERAMAIVRMATAAVTLFDMNDVIASPTTPSNPIDGTLWYKPADKKLYVYQGGGWKYVGEFTEEEVGAIKITLGNIADDNKITVLERSFIKEKLVEIIGFVIGDTTTTLPTLSALDTSKVGGVYSLRAQALNIGIPNNDADYTAFGTAYTNLKTYLDGLTPKPWDSGVTNQDTATTIAVATYRDWWLKYFKAADALAEKIAAKAKENVDNVKVGGNNAIRDGNFASGGMSFWRASGNVANTYQVRNENSFPLSNKHGYVLTDGIDSEGLFAQDFIPVVIGETYTVSAWFYITTGVASIQVGNGVMGYQVQHLTTLKKWTRISLTFTATTSTVNVYFGAKGNMNTGVVASMVFTCLQMEQGTIPTDYTPSIADTQSKNAVGLGVKINQSTFTAASDGEMYLHGFNMFGYGEDIDGYLIVNGEKIVVPKQQGNVSITGSYYLMFDKTNNFVYGVTVSEDFKYQKIRFGETTVNFTPTADHIFFGSAYNSAIEMVESVNLWSSPKNYVEMNDTALTKLVEVWKSNAVKNGKVLFNGGLIEANTVLAQQIAIGDFTNMVQIDAENNPNGNPIVTVSNLNYFKVGQTAWSPIRLVESKTQEFAVNDYYYFAGTGYKDAAITGVFTAYVRYYYTDGTNTNAGSATFSMGTTASKWSVKVKITADPTATKTISSVTFEIQKDNTATGYYYLRALEIRKMYAGNLLVDGEITASHIKSLNGLNVGNGKFVIDANGDVTFAGTLNGANGTFSGSLSTNNLLIQSGGTSSQITFDSGPVLGRGKITFSGGVDGSGNITSPLSLDIGKSVAIGYDIFYSNLSYIKLWASTVEISGKLDMNGTNIERVNLLTFADPGVDEGISWLGGNLWKIYEAPDTLTNAKGNLQFVTGSTRRMTISSTDGSIWSSGHIEANLNVTASGLVTGTNGVIGYEFKSTDGYVRLKDSAGVEIVAVTARDTPLNHTFIKNNATAIKMLNSTTLQIQFRNAADTAYVDTVSKNYQTISKREYKKNIFSYEGSGLQAILTTPIRTYHYLDELDEEFPHIGVIVDESPVEIIDLRGEGVNAYSMASLAFKAIQEEDEKVTVLEGVVLGQQEAINDLASKVTELMNVISVMQIEINELKKR